MFKLAYKRLKVKFRHIIDQHLWELWRSLTYAWLDNYIYKFLERGFIKNLIDQHLSSLIILLSLL